MTTVYWVILITQYWFGGNTNLAVCLNHCCGKPKHLHFKVRLTDQVFRFVEKEEECMRHENAFLFCMENQNSKKKKIVKKKK